MGAKLAVYKEQVEASEQPPATTTLTPWVPSQKTSAPMRIPNIERILPDPHSPLVMVALFNQAEPFILCANPDF
jgi:hypothetical protein